MIWYTRSEIEQSAKSEKFILHVLLQLHTVCWHYTVSQKMRHK